MSSRQRGTAMVELAILMPLLVIMVFGVVELGRALYQQQVVTKVATTAARYMSRSYGVVDAACATTGEWATRLAEARTLAVTGGDGAPVVANLKTGDIAVSVIARTLPAPSSPECVVRVDLQTPFNGVFGDTLIPLTDIGRVKLNARVEEVYIGE